MLTAYSSNLHKPGCNANHCLAPVGLYSVEMALTDLKKQQHVWRPQSIKYSWTASHFQPYHLAAAQLTTDTFTKLNIGSLGV